jgi:hypothetical protein
MSIPTLSGSSEPLDMTPNRDRKKELTQKKDNYFDLREEMAVRMFLTATTITEKNQIYNDYLREPLDRMIDSIIRRYNLYRKGMDFREIHHDTHSFLITKVSKFMPSRNKKAYSYFGTICKNYLMGQIIKDRKDVTRRISYEDVTSKLETLPDMIYYIDKDNVDTPQMIEIFIEKLNTFIEDEELNEPELRLGYALIELFENYEDIFVGSNNNKFNKNVILLSLREMTNMTTKEIRSSMKKYKKLYYEVITKINDNS